MTRNDYRKEAVLVGIALFIALIVFVGEGLGSWYSHSTSLSIDTLHVLADFATLIVSLIIPMTLFWSAPRDNRSIEETERAHALRRKGSIINAWLLLAVVIGVGGGAVVQLIRNDEVHGSIVFWVAVAGLIGNLLQRKILSRCPCAYHRSIQLHIDSDLKTSLAVIIAGPAVAFTGWNWIDPAFALGIAIYIAKTTRMLFRSIELGENGHHH